MGEGVTNMAYLLTFLASVAANVVSDCICKWLGRYDKDRKPN